MDERRLKERDADKEILRNVFDALGFVEIGLDALTPQGESEAIDLVLQLRRKIIEEFSHVETGTELESDAS